MLFVSLHHLEYTSDSSFGFCVGRSANCLSLTSLSSSPYLNTRLLLTACLPVADVGGQFDNDPVNSEGKQREMTCARCVVTAKVGCRT